VEHWNNTTKTLVFKPVSGTIAIAPKVLWKSGNTAQANVSSVVLSLKLTADDILISNKDGNKSVQVSTYTHKHGVISAASTGTTVRLSANVTSSVSGQKIKFTTGPSLSTERTIASVVGTSNNQIVLNSAVTVDGATKYSIGTNVTDSYGNIAGLFNLPETSEYKFKTGERIFTITDTTVVSDSDATTRASAKYYSSGMYIEREVENVDVTPVIPPVESTNLQVEIDPVVDQVSTPIRTAFTRFNFPRGRRSSDPVAQTFFTPKSDNGKEDYGVFITSVDLFFKTKPSGTNDPKLPVTVKIVETENGYPTAKIIAESTVSYTDVKTTDGATTFPSVSNSSTYTKFSFRDPVYLNPASEYAIVVYSDSPSYEVWISELGQSIVGDANQRRVSEQPYIGSFFRSQNASTWTPYQNQDLMFRINKAKFSTSSTTLNFNVEKPAKDIPYDDLILHSKELNFPLTDIDYKIKTTLYSTSALDSDYTFIDHNEPIKFSALPGGTISTGKRRVVKAGNSASLQASAVLSSYDDKISPIFNSESFDVLLSQNVINNGEISNNNITVTSGGSHTDVANVNVVVSESDLYPDDETARAVLVPVLNDAGTMIESLYVSSPGRGYVESPTVTITDTTSVSNATAVIISEDGKSGGNGLARYMTKKVTLADGFDSGDLRVTVRAIRPQGTNIVVYYKVQSGSDPRSFSDVKWRRMYLENDIISPTVSDPIDFNYRPSSDTTRNRVEYLEDGIQYPIGGTFKYFAIKIVMFAECGCVSPTVNNLRAIALPGG
jgi:hypothetical protein